MRLYQEAGGNARRAIMSHVERKTYKFYLFEVSRVKSAELKSTF